MSILYFINNTANTHGFTIKPGELNGPGGKTADTDLRLYGMGAQQWGEGVDENLYRLLECSSCPKKTPSDPGYNATKPIPQDALDLGMNLGINNPVGGQLWYENADKILYIYNEADDMWRDVAGSAIVKIDTSFPTDNVHDGGLWYDETNNQLKIYYSGSWDSVAAKYLPLTGGTLTGPLDVQGYVAATGTGSFGGILNMNTNRIINVVDPVNNQDAATKKYTDDAIAGLGNSGVFDGKYVNLTGDSMTGSLSLVPGTTGPSSLTISSTETNVKGIEVSATGGAYVLLSSINGGNAPSFVTFTPGVSKGYMRLNNQGGYFNIQAATSAVGTSAHTVLTAVESGEMRYYGNGVAGAGQMILNNSTILGINNASSKAVTTVEWVQDQITGSASNIAVINPSAPKSGDISVSGGNIYIRDGSVWRQIYPALYS